MASYKIELNSHPNSGSEEHKLMLRITVDQKHARITLPYSVKKNQFNPKAKNDESVREIEVDYTKYDDFNS